MKNLLFLGIVLLLASCSQDDDVITQGNTAAAQQVQTTVSTGGDWRITSFIDSGDDETAYFAGYTFQFLANDVVEAVSSSTTYTGTWSVGSNSSDDDSSSDLDFNLFFALTNKFEELNDDWDIVSQSATKLELIDVSGGNGGTDYLTFER